MRNALAGDMIYRSIIGPAPAEQSEIPAFLSGFQLPCRNGFDFCMVSID